MQAEARSNDGWPWISGAYALEPEVVLPAQFHAGVDLLQAGEMRLLWAVLIDGVTTFCLETLSRRTDGRTYREVERWIFNPGSGSVTSFTALCEVFGIDPRRLRRAIRRFREQPPRAFLPLVDRAATRRRRRASGPTVLPARRRTRKRKAAPYEVERTRSDDRNPEGHLPETGNSLR